ncbi:MAG: MucB/RseB C-terminal domain-containing protein [Gammaproteobacteria bacterium]|jgi:sigma-E factor negative regulatory protein RseB|nr:MucB/RseB C-terminal domain-containing protein [Gammaproteobacteria bacterium]
MIKYGVGLLLVWLTLSQAVASEDGWKLVKHSQQAVKTFNFDVSFVQQKANHVSTFRWMHGIHQGNGALGIQTELEQLMTQDGYGTDTFRRDNFVYYAAPDAPVVATLNSSIKELPAILFKSPEVLAKLFDAVPGSSVALSGRNAQLVRLAARDPSRYSYWLWLDAETGFPLRVNTVNEENEVLESWMVVHMQLKPSLPAELVGLMNAQLPAEPAALPTDVSSVAAPFTLSWVPAGYDIISQHQPVMTRSGRVMASWLLSDGIHQISIFVQPSNGIAEAQAFRDGATTILVVPQQNYDVTVIGPVNPKIANQLAVAVQ